MKRLTLDALVLGALALTLAACSQAGDASAGKGGQNATSQPGSAAGAAVRSESRQFHQWYAVCDNGNACATYSGGSTGWFKIALDAGPGGHPLIQVGMWPDGTENLPGPLVVVIDGKRHATTPSTDGSYSASISGDAARAVVVDLAAGRTLTLTAGSQAVEVPTAGSSAAMLWIDERQGRLDTVTALVRRGQKSAATVPTAPDRPVIIAAPAVSQTGFKAALDPVDSDKPTPNAVPPAPLEAVPRVKQCRADTSFNEYLQKAVTASRLDATTELWGIPCDGGAYNFSYAYYLTGPGGTNPRLALFPDVDGRTTPTAEGESDLLVNPTYDPNTRILSAFAKGRGLGDCGVSQSWTWTGEAFVLNREQVMADCWGMSSDFWPTTYRSRNH